MRLRKVIVVIKDKLIKLLSGGHERTIKARKNIFLSILYKGGSIAISIIIIPLTITYVNSDTYGIWITLSSIISWFSFFDVGLGNGLKNKLAENNALNETSKSKSYISTTYVILGVISLIVFVVFYFANKFVNWNTVLNTKITDNHYLRHVVLLLVSLFSIQFVTQIINSILTAFHKSARVALITFLGQLLSLTFIFFIRYYISGSLILLVISMAGIPLIVQLLASLIYFSKEYKVYSPSFKYVDLSQARDLLSVGGKFFFIQIGALILFQTDNIVITQVFGPADVTIFNIAYKLFSVLILLFSIIITPLWSAYTDAYAKNDWIWIRSSMIKMQKFWMVLSVCSLALLAASSFVYRLWLHGSVSVPLSLSVAMAVYVICYVWQSIHVYFLNGVGKVKLQLYLVMGCSVVNIPMAIFFAKYWGLAGVTYSNVVLIFITGVIFSIQCKKIINHTATGIFNK
ncbi:O-antigen/teichoic acid export membrane protein [Mucilaginibacter gracilis]|uniref:O-antigen/teichoic acid export membrane protein n=1 Tax=Mucilaginibacter gracilis TaxID=423350 RepID=A0A495IWN0_9SPHI|nr:oligosaccharide flippase family protein [Mucilaginibacter gracilis]RKR81080.1 O-antigen/teichoic acid export membrane protein [Mucilaginibacter gracilis]